MYIPQQTHVVPLVTVRRDRRLPVPGEVVARMNQRVAATDVVARASVSPDHRLLDFGRSLGLPAARADQVLIRKPGESLTAGDALTSPVGLMRRRFTVPVDGRLVAAGGGQALLEAAVEPFELPAGMPGLVVNVEAGLGVTIETTGALIQGVWGNGKQDFGVLRVPHERAEDELTGEALDVSLRGAILAVGGCYDAPALRVAAEIKPRGLILGTLAAPLRDAVLKLPFPVLVLDGFANPHSPGGVSGRTGINPPAFELLKGNNGREVSLDARPADRYGGRRPEVIIPLPLAASSLSGAGLPVEGEALAPGQRVRLLRAPHRGEVGLVVTLHRHRRLLPNGARALAADVEVAGIGTVLVPFANLEILE
ncbi:MAG: hypothetical protein HY784_03875 [Chloroflexi bacterium]|nr:hypothetical protein [Chloroflexota bacterium]